MATLVMDTTTLATAGTERILLTIAPEIRLRIYKEVFRGFIVYISTQYERIYEGDNSARWSAQQCIEAKVDSSLLLTCRKVYSEAQGVYDQSIRFVLAYDTTIESMRGVMYSPDVHKRIIWLPISQGHETEPKITEHFPKLTKLEIQEGGDNMFKLPYSRSMVQRGKNTASKDGNYEAEFKTLAKTRCDNLPALSWQRKALAETRGKAQITHLFHHEPPLGEDRANYRQSNRIVTVEFDIETMRTLHRRVVLFNGSVKDYWYAADGSETGATIRFLDVHESDESDESEETPESGNMESQVSADSSACEKNEAAHEVHYLESTDQEDGQQSGEDSEL